MKIHSLSYLLFFILLLGSLSSCNKDNEANSVPDTVKFMVISDIHYFDPSLFTLPANSSLEAYLASDHKLILESSAILKNVLTSVLVEKPNFLLVTGDLTKDGEKIDHQAVAALFKTLSDNGIKVLVINGNHDVNKPNAYSYIGSSQTPIANISASDFASIYTHCGYSNAIERDASSLSYVSEPVNGIWVLGIDACHYSPVNEGAGSISDNTLSWVKTIIAKAKTQKKILLTMMHHGMIEHFTGQSSIFSQYVISNWENVSTSLADLGMHVVFTGHFHAQDITKKTGVSGFIYDIETGSTVSSPCPYRIVTLDTVTKTLKIVSKDIDGVTFSTIPSGMTFQQYAKDYLTTGAKAIAYKMLSSAPYNIPASEISYYGLDRIMANALIAHYAGDESPSTSDNTDIQTVKQIIPSVGVALQNIWTDLDPSDNNVTINLTTGIASAN